MAEMLAMTSTIVLTVAEPTSLALYDQKLDEVGARYDRQGHGADQRLPPL